MSYKQLIEELKHLVKNTNEVPEEMRELIMSIPPTSAELPPIITDISQLIIALKTQEQYYTIIDGKVEELIICSCSPSVVVYHSLRETQSCSFRQLANQGIYINKTIVNKILMQMNLTRLYYTFSVLKEFNNENCGCILYLTGNNIIQLKEVHGECFGNTGFQLHFCSKSQAKKFKNFIKGKI